MDTGQVRIDQQPLIPKEPVVVDGTLSTAPPTVESATPTVETPPSPQDVHIPQQPLSKPQKKSWKEIFAATVADAAEVLAKSTGSMVGGGGTSLVFPHELMKVIHEWKPSDDIQHTKILTTHDPFYEHEGYYKLDEHEGYHVSPSSLPKYKNLNLKDLNLSEEFVNTYKLHEPSPDGETVISMKEEFLKYFKPKSSQHSPVVLPTWDIENPPPPDTQPPPPLDSREQISREVSKKLSDLKVYASNARQWVSPALVPWLRKLNLEPAEFFTARACWQGANGSKRRRILGAVLREFAGLPKGEKTWQSALEKAKANGAKVKNAGDEYFIGYFFEHRKALKALFRASLRQWQGDSIVCYRGRSVGRKDPDKEPLECYSLDPSTSRSFSDKDNVKQHRVKLGDVWSVFTVTQNKCHSELELTVYSAGGKRRGKVVPKNFGDPKLRTNFPHTGFTSALQHDSLF